MEGLKSTCTTQKIIDFVSESGANGRRYIEIIKFIYEMKYGVGTYSYKHRGYWAGSFKTPSRDDRRFGHLMYYLEKADNGRWVVRDKKMSFFEAFKAGQNFIWKNKTKYKERMYPAIKNMFN